MLAIEASNPSAGPEPGMACVAGACVDDDGHLRPIIEIPYRAASRERDGLLPAIEAVRSALGVHPGGLVRVCVSVGPGGYTGLRVSVTVAKAIAHATGAELVGVPSATIAVGDERPCGPFVVCLASKGDRTHVTVFAESGSGDGEAIGVVDAACVGGVLDDLNPGSGEKILIADGYLPEPIRAACLNRGGHILAPRFTASRCLHAGYGRASIDPIELVPVYAREPEAVRLWRDRRSTDAQRR